MINPTNQPGVRLVTTSLISENVATYGKIDDAIDVVKLLRDQIGYSDRENVVVLYLNTRHHVTHMNVASIGTLNGSSVHPREIFKGAILANAHAIILAHNHPSGDVLPSSDDNKITERIRLAGELLGINLLDHIILSHNDKYYSSASETVHTIE